jgi:hypothetical protein
MDALAILLGWPSLIGAWFLASAAIWWQRPALAWLALALILPVAVYLSGSPAYPLSGVIPVAGLAVTASYCRRTVRYRSLSGLGIYTVFLTGLGLLVLSE